MAGGGGFEPPLRGPEPRVLPLDDPPATASAFPAYGPRRGKSTKAAPPSADGGLEAPARAEARNLGGWDLDRLARARVAPVTPGAAGDHEGAEPGDRDAPAAPERLEDPHDHGVERLLRGGLGAARGLRHDRDEVGLGHAFLPTRPGWTVSMASSPGARRRGRAPAGRASR